MNIGIIIFVISVVISIISAMRDKDHEKRQNQKPPQKPKREKNIEQQPKKGGFFEQIEEMFNELDREMSGEPTQTEKSKPAIPDNQPKNVYKDEKLEQEIEKETISDSQQREEEQLKRVRQSRDSERPSQNRESMNREPSNEDLENTLMGDLKRVRSDIDKEKEKQLALIERKAKDIINDKNLSYRAKQYRLKQLLNTKSIEQNMSNQTLQFDNDPVINGLIWQEVLNKPKRL